MLLLIYFFDTESPNATVSVNDSDDNCIVVTVQYEFINDLEQLNATYNLIIECPDYNSTAVLNSSLVTDASSTYVCSNNITTNGSTTVGEIVGGCPDLYKVSVNVSIGG